MCRGGLRQQGFIGTSVEEGADRLRIFGLFGIFVMRHLIKPHCPSALKGLAVATR